MATADDGGGGGDARIGTVLQGRYLLLARIAEGSMGAVYRAERVQLGRPVAVKFLHPALARDPQLVRRFEVEARAMSRLQHPNCVSVIDFGVADLPYLVMDLVHGRSLREEITGPVPPARALRIARQVLAALAHAHAHGVVHRDVKPENILVEQGAGLADHVRVLDFGLAKILDAQHALTVGLAVGTPNYMAPEQIGEGTVGERTDLYGVGIVLHEMLTGQKPFDAPEVAEILRRHREMPPPRLRDATPAAGLSPELEGLVQRALAKDPELRFPSAQEMAEALDRLPEAGAGPGASDRTLKEPTRALRADGRLVAPGLRGPAIRRLGALAAGALARARALTRRAWASRAGRAAIAGAGVAALSIVLGLALAGRRASPSPPGPAAAPIAAAQAAPPPPDVPPPAPAPVSPAAALAEVDALVAQGERDQAIAQLVALRRGAPRNAEYHAALARLYFEKRWWTAGLDAFRAAARHDPARRSDPALLAHSIDALGSDKARREAGKLLRDLGPAARAQVQEAARTHPSRRVRERAADVARTWNCRGFFCP